jgi:EAL domain-containing protein (putative c-di-GMP-specific phosphodiesterase class I)
VIERAMADWWHFAERHVPLKLAVNMPASVILAPDFVGLVRQYLPATADFPGLIVEITEDEVISEPELIREIATQLKLYNVSISIDDFGSGYASLSRLKDLPFAEVKIDRGFVDNCASNQLKHGLCQTIVDLAHRFGASVCAEGVESAPDLRALINMGCDSAQGFLFAKPMPAEQLATLMRSRSHLTGAAGRRAGELHGARTG